ncbi:hypothetical protein Hanom_Chr15g01384111 [Helianthus anomalus]
MDQNAPALQDKIGGCNSQQNRFFGFWTKMATKCKPQGPRCNKFEIWIKVAKLAKPQGPKWQFTLLLKSYTNIIFYISLTYCIATNRKK